MKKRDKIYDSPEYQEIKEHLPEILEELENAKKSEEYQIPEEWNKDFQRIYRTERRKERIRKSLLAAVCSAAVLSAGIIFAGGDLEGGSVVQADDMEKTKKENFEQGDYQYNTYGNSEIIGDGMISEDDGEINFSCNSLSELYTEIKEKTKAPIFILSLSSDGYIVEDAFYSKEHRNFSYRLENGSNYLYISQQMQIDKTGNGTINDYKESTIHIEKLNIDVDIYRSAQDDSLKCDIVYHNEVLSIVSNMDMEEYESVIRSVEYH